MNAPVRERGDAVIRYLGYFATAHALLVSANIAYAAAANYSPAARHDFPDRVFSGATLLFGIRTSVHA
jgi:hypothetical protein